MQRGTIFIGWGCLDNLKAFDAMTDYTVATAIAHLI
jgi:hypothetical protein